MRQRRENRHTDLHQRSVATRSNGNESKVSGWKGRRARHIRALPGVRHAAGPRHRSTMTDWKRFARYYPAHVHGSPLVLAHVIPNRTSPTASTRRTLTPSASNNGLERDGTDFNRNNLRATGSSLLEKTILLLRRRRDRDGGDIGSSQSAHDARLVPRLTGAY